MTHIETYEVIIVGYGSRHVVLLPWALGVLLEMSLLAWAEDPYLS